MYKKKICLLVFVAIFYISHLASFAQINDAQFWENINIEKKLTQQLTVRAVQEGRFTENFTRPSFNYFDVGFNYKINKHLHATLAYVWVEKRQLNDLLSTRHQAYTDLTIRKKFNNFLFSDRQMFLWQVKNYYTSPLGKFNDFYFRNKITIRYDKYFKVAPYIASEIYYRVYGPSEYMQYHFNRIRYFGGVFYRPDLINEFELYYLIQHQFDRYNAPQNNNNLAKTNYWIIGLGYSHSF